MPDRIRLALFGLFAVATATVWFVNSNQARDETPQQRAVKECYRYIDAIQLWYIRPEYQNGNGRQNFAHFDAKSLGFTDSDDLQEWERDGITYKLENPRFSAFDFVAVLNDGTRIEFKNIKFDSRPQYMISQ